MDKALKQRLVGASVLVALAVVVLPMLLGGDTSSPQEARTIELPLKPRETTFETRRFPIGEQDPGQPSQLERQQPDLVASPLPTPTTQAPVVQPAEREQPQADAEVTGTSTAPPTPDAEAVAGAQAANESIIDARPKPQPVTELSTRKDGRYLVQVASFSSTGNANRLASQLGEADLPVLMDTVTAAAGTLHRVRVGPFERRQQADQVIGDLNRLIPDLQPRVLDLRPNDESAVTTPSDPLVRWLVQVGSFSDAQNAESLVYQLRDAGFRASTKAVSSAGATAHKVQVGPVLERDDAVRLAASIKDKVGLDGLVMSTD